MHLEFKYFEEWGREKEWSMVSYVIESFKGGQPNEGILEIGSNHTKSCPILVRIGVK